MKTGTCIFFGLPTHVQTIATTGQLFFRRAWLWTGFLAFAAVFFEPQPAQAAVTEAWVQRYGSETGSEDRAFQVVTDADGSVIVAGTIGHDHPGSGSDMLVIKYSGTGVPLWTNCYSGTSADVAVDASGNVFVAGSSYSAAGAWDYAVIAFSGAGVPLWTNLYTGAGNQDDRAVAIAVDGSGRVFLTGSSYGSGSSYDYATIAYSGAGVPLWTNYYNGPANGLDEAIAVVVGAGGNVFVTGRSAGSGGGDFPSDYATIAYSGVGVPLWTNRYNGPANSDDLPRAVAADRSGNVFVTGSSSGYWDGFDWNSDYATIAYSGAGVPLWTNLYSGPGNRPDQAVALAVDTGGNVFVTGNYYPFGSGGLPETATIAYSNAGVPRWINHHTGSASALAVDGSGNVFVTGSSEGDYATIAYSGAGVLLWTNHYNGPENGHDFANAVAVDGSGNVFVTGLSGYLCSHLGCGGGDYGTIAYSGAGVALWTNRHGGQGAASDVPNAVAVDGSGSVFVAGYSYGIPGFEDYATIAYSAAGAPLWTNRYDGPGNSSDQAVALAVDASGNVYVTGNSGDFNGFGFTYDYATIAYSSTGVPLWTNRYDGPENLSDEVIALAVDGSGNVFVTGNSGLPSGYATTIAYSGAGVPLWTNRYDGQARALAVDGSGNVFVTGWSGFQCHWGCIGGSYTTIAYSGAGVALWTNRYSGSLYDSAWATAVAVDASGNVFVTGSSGNGFTSHYATIAYSGAGVPLWTNRYSGSLYDPASASAVAVDGSGNVFVTGTSDEGSGDDYATIAYSGAGVPLWTNRYNGPENGWDRAIAVAVDGSGNVIVTGSSLDSDGLEDFATIAYSGAGVPLWTNRYNGPGISDDQPQTKSSLAIGSDSAVYVTGASAGLFSSDFVTVKYVWQTEITIQLLSTIPPKVNLTLSGAPNSSCAIEWAPEPNGPWTNLNEILIGPNGSAQIQDTNAPSPAGFYRARRPAFPRKGA